MDEYITEDEAAVEESPDIYEVENEYDTDYKRTVQWDFEKGDFLRDGNGNMIECTGYEGYKVWCVKTTLTQRNALRAYPEEIGAELEEALAWDDHGIVETELQNTITEALLVNPRTRDVGEFDFQWEGDSLHVQFVVTPILYPPFIVSI